MAIFHFETLLNHIFIKKTKFTIKPFENRSVKEAVQTIKTKHYENCT